MSEGPKILTSIADTLADRIRERAAAGEREYGVSLDDADIDPLEHAIEEVLDLAAYLERERRDRDLDTPELPDDFDAGDPDEPLSVRDREQIQEHVRARLDAGWRDCDTVHLRRYEATLEAAEERAEHAFDEAARDREQRAAMRGELDATLDREDREIRERMRQKARADTAEERVEELALEIALKGNGIAGLRNQLQNERQRRQEAEREIARQDKEILRLNAQRDACREKLREAERIVDQHQKTIGEWNNFAALIGFDCPHTPESWKQVYLDEPREKLREARELLRRWSDILVFRSHGYMLDPLCGVQERTDLASDTRTFLDAGSDDDE